ncbi:MAG: entericidin A/B family lipoprotein [Candidatus Hydrogenedentota bacterium]
MTAFKKVVIAVVVGVLVSMGTFGCNTVRGMGKDVQRSGEAVEDAADGAQRK